MALSKTSHVFLQPTTWFWAEFAQLVQVWRSLEGASKSFLTSQKTDFLWTGDEKTRCERRIVLVSVNGKLFRREKKCWQSKFCITWDLERCCWPENSYHPLDVHSRRWTFFCQLETHSSNNRHQDESWETKPKPVELQPPTGNYVHRNLSSCNCSWTDI